MKKNIVIIGFMGTGKTAVGLRLAQKLDLEFVDMDREIEALSGMSIKEIFRRYGEIRFRSEESLMAKKLGQRESLVIATGGGTVTREENVGFLRQNGILICLDAQPQDILERVNLQKGTRPLLKKNTRVQDIEELLNQRQNYYACADIRVDNSGKSLDQIVNEIWEALKHYLD